MSTHIRHIMMAILAILALIIIFLPLAFDKKEFLIHNMLLPQSVPKPPIFKPLSAEAQMAIAQTLAGKPTVTLDAQAFESMPTMLSAKAQANYQAMVKPQAWVIQVGSYQNQNAALNMVGVLQRFDQDAFVQPFTKNNQSMFRVLIGPMIKYDQAKAIATELSNRLKVKGIVVAFDPGLI